MTACKNSGYVPELEHVDKKKKREIERERERKKAS
jgi:hypothetical protein